MKRRSSSTARTICLSFAWRVRGGARLEKARHLHGERGAARHHPAVPEHLPGGAQHGERIDAVVPVEAPVLESLQQGEIARIHLRGRDRKAPAPLVRREGPQKPALPVEGTTAERCASGDRSRGPRLST